MKNVKFIQISFWLAAIADIIYGIVIWIPSRAGVDEYVYPTGLFSVVAISWGIMLIMASSRPLERRWILIPTILVISLIGVANLYSFAVGAATLNLIVPRLLLVIGIVAFMIFAYIKTKELKTNK